MSDQRQRDALIHGQMASNFIANYQLAATPTENDVLFGRCVGSKALRPASTYNFHRGASMSRWPGNVQFRKLLSKRTEEYISTSCRAQKHRIAIEIIETIRSRMNGRFLIRASATGDESMVTESNPGPWILAEESIIVDKVKQAIREKHYQERRPGRKANQSSLRKTKSGASSEAEDKKPKQNLPAAKADARAQLCSPKNPKKSPVEAQDRVAIESHRTNPDWKTGRQHYDVEQDRKRQRLLSSSREWKQQSHGRGEEALRMGNQNHTQLDAIGQGAAMNEVIRKKEEEVVKSLLERRFGPSETERLPSLYDGTPQLGSLPFASSVRGSISESLTDRLRSDADRSGHAGTRETYGGYPIGSGPLQPGLSDVLSSERTRNLRHGVDFAQEEPHSASGMHPQYSRLLDSERNDGFDQQHFRRTSWDSCIGGLVPAREVANHATGQQLPNQWGSVQSRERGISPDEPASTRTIREELMEMLSQQRRITEELLALRRQQE